MAKVLEFPAVLADEIVACCESRRNLAAAAAFHHRQFGHDRGPFWRCSREACKSAAEILEIPRGLELLPAELA